MVSMCSVAAWRTRRRDSSASPRTLGSAASPSEPTPLETWTPMGASDFSRSGDKCVQNADGSNTFVSCPCACLRRGPRWDNAPAADSGRCWTSTSSHRRYRPRSPRSVSVTSKMDESSGQLIGGRCPRFRIAALPSITWCRLRHKVGGASRTPILVCSGDE